MENDSRGRGAENIYGGSDVESRKKYGLKRRGKIKYNAVRRGRSTLIAALLQSGRGVFGCRWRRGLWIWGLLMDYNIAPLYISSPKVQWCTWCTKNGRPWPLLPTAQTHPLHPCLVCCTPKGWRLLDAPPDCLGGCSSAMRQWLIRLDCGAVRCRCFDAAAPQPARERKRPHSLLTARVCWSGFRFPPSQSPKLTVADKHSLTRFGNPSRFCLAGGFFGCRSPGIRQGNCASLGPLPSGLSGEAEVWPRSPGEQAPKPPKPPNNELAVPANQHPPPQPSHPHTHTHTRTEATAEKERTRKWTAWRRARRSWEGSAAYRSMCLSRQNSGITLGSLWDHSNHSDHSGIAQCRALSGTLAQIHSSESSNVELASASGETCESLAWRTSPFASLFLSQTTWWWLEPSREDVRLFVDDSVLPNRPTSSLSAVPGESVVLPEFLGYRRSRSSLDRDPQKP